MLAAALAGCVPPLPEILTTGDETTDEPVGQTVVLNELIVAVTPGADPQAVQALFDETGATVQDRLQELALTLLQVAPENHDETAETLEASPLIEGVFDNQVLEVEIPPDDPEYSRQWHLTAIECPAAWEITTGSPSMLIAVLDTGVDPQHADLASKLRSGGNTVDGDGWSDVHGHGTAVAGVAAALPNNQLGVASVAWANPILPIRVANEKGEATSWQIAAGISLAVQAGAKVVNVSIAPLHHDAVVLRQAEWARAHGALLVFAAGNDGQQVLGGGSEAALFVGGVGESGARWGTSSYGSFISLVAPGAAIYTTQLGNTYAASTGTSFAAPIVSGVAALVWSVNPSLRATTVQGILLATADDLGPPGDDGEYGAGRVNARAAVELARAIVETPDTTPPELFLAQPEDGATVSGAFLIEVQVADDGDVADVTLWLDNEPVAVDTVPPYAFVLDTTLYALGAHTLSAVAADVFGNTADVHLALEFKVAEGDKQAPTVAMVSPRDDQTVSGVVTVLADAADDAAIERAEVVIDGAVADSFAVNRSEARIAYNWDTTAPSVLAGPHAVAVRVYDTSGNSRAASVRVIVAK